MHRPIQGLVAIAFLGSWAFFYPKVASSQTLAQTSWDEFISLTVGEDGKELQGSDSAIPEPIADSLAIPGWGLSGALTYGPPGPPQFTAHCFGKATSGPNSYQGSGPNSYQAFGDSIAETRGLVAFEFAVRTITTPPVVVTDVPVTISAHGATFIRGSVACPQSDCLVDGDPAAFVQILMVSQGMTLMNRTVTSASIKASDHIVNVGQTVYLEPDIVVSGSVEAMGLVRMNRFTASGQWGEATATITPDFAISTDLIPGTNSPYSDYFQIEYSPGYWALGDPTPVAPTTWGKIKTLYSRP